MNLKKLTPHLVSGIMEAGFDKAPKYIQSNSIPVIKSGADLFVLAPEGSGKSSTIVIGVIQQLKEAFEEAPRAIVIVPTKEKAYELEAQFELLGKNTNLRTFIAFEKGILQYQKDMIYEGLDVLICTPRRLTELVNINGVPLTKVKVLAVDDAEEIIGNRYHAIIYRIADGIKKIQFLIFMSSWHERLDILSERIMKNPITITTENHDN